MLDRNPSGEKFHHKGASIGQLAGIPLHEIATGGIWNPCNSFLSRRYVNRRHRRRVMNALQLERTKSHDVIEGFHERMGDGALNERVAAGTPLLQKASRLQPPLQHRIELFRIEKARARRL